MMGKRRWFEGVALLPMSLSLSLWCRWLQGHDARLNDVSFLVEPYQPPARPEARLRDLPMRSLKSWVWSFGIASSPSNVEQELVAIDKERQVIIDHYSERPSPSRVSDLW
jgi:hypothetical protein